MNEKINNLYNQIVSGDGWDYSTLEELMREVRSKGFDDGANWYKNQQPRLQTLVFNRGTACTPIKTYDIEFDDENRMFDVWIEGEHYESFNTEPEAIDYCNSHYRELIESCYSNVHD